TRKRWSTRASSCGSKRTWRRTATSSRRSSRRPTSCATRRTTSASRRRPASATSCLRFVSPNGWIKRPSGIPRRPLVVRGCRISGRVPPRRAASLRIVESAPANPIRSGHFFHGRYMAAGRIGRLFSIPPEEFSMKHVKWTRMLCAITALLMLAVSAGASAQTLTTGTLSGHAADQQGGVLPGVTVTAIHEPTGTKYEVITGADGRFQIPNVRVGGPYTVTAALSGFRDATERDVNVALGEDKSVEFKLALASVTETLTVTAEAPIIDSSRAGTASN